jgi:hypothetical protein
MPSASALFRSGVAVLYMKFVDKQLSRFWILVDLPLKREISA